MNKIARFQGTPDLLAEIESREPRRSGRDDEEGESYAQPVDYLRGAFDRITPSMPRAYSRKRALLRTPCCVFQFSTRSGIV